MIKEASESNVMVVGVISGLGSGRDGVLGRATSDVGFSLFRVKSRSVIG